jgi:hypothetical protein
MPFGCEGFFKFGGSRGSAASHGTFGSAWPRVARAQAVTNIDQENDLLVPPDASTSLIPLEAQRFHFMWNPPRN